MKTLSTSVINGNERCIVPFLNRGRDDESGVDNEVDPLADDSFFVELVSLRGVEVARLRANQIEREEPEGKRCFAIGSCSSCGTARRLSLPSPLPCSEGESAPCDAGARELQEGVAHVMTAPVIDEATSNSDILYEKVQEIKILNKYQKNQLQAVLERNREVFSQRLGLCKTYVHHFEVNDLTPYEYRSRPIPSSMIEDVNKTIQKMLDDHVIEPADSSFINPLCIVRKPSGEVRITVDARKLNARSRMNYFRNENVESLLNKVNGAKFLTILDLSADWSPGTM